MTEIPSLVKRAQEKRDFEKLAWFWREFPPYWYQWDYWAASQHFNTLLTFSGNQVGKSVKIATALALHGTGRYDYIKDWPGRVWLEPPVSGNFICYLFGPTTDSVKDNLQEKLFGPENSIGSGFIPKDAIIDWNYRHSSAGVMSNAFVRWEGPFGRKGVTEYRIKSYDMGTSALSGPTAHFAGSDEHGQLGVWNELRARLLKNQGLLMAACTPALTKVQAENDWIRTIRKKCEDPKARYFFMTVGMDQAKHFTPEMIGEFEASCTSEAERKARVYGLTDLYGAGLVYNVGNDDILAKPGVDCPLEIPNHWDRVAGIDFGTADGTAIVWLARDPRTKIVYLYDEEFQTTTSGYTGGFLLGMAEAVRRRGPRVTMAWPHDGGRHADGMTLKQNYVDRGCIGFMSEPVNKYEAGVSAGCVKLLTAMQQGIFKVYPNCRKWFEEKDAYLWADDGNGVKRRQRDHLMDATRYAFQALPYACPVSDTEDEGGYSDEQSLSSTGSYYVDPYGGMQ